jgi:phage terminase large subunit-like protein
MSILPWIAIILLLISLVMAMFDEHRAQRAVKFFESLKHTKGKFAGKPFILLPWERKIIWDVYGTVKENGLRQFKYIYIEVPKKNGKSELAAGAALYHLFADHERNGEVYGCAADKEQATLVFDVAEDMVEMAPALDKRTRFDKSTKLITDTVSGSFYKVMSSEAYTKHGLNLSACIFDERMPSNRDLWDVIPSAAMPGLADLVDHPP